MCKRTFCGDCFNLQYDLATPECPVNFRVLDHVNPNFSQQEAKDLISMHMEHWGCRGWEEFNKTLLGLSELSGEEDKFHAGVIMHGCRKSHGKREKAAGWQASHRRFSARTFACGFIHAQSEKVLLFEKWYHDKADEGSSHDGLPHHIEKTSLVRPLLLSSEQVL